MRGWVSETCEMLIGWRARCIRQIDAGLMTRDVREVSMQGCGTRYVRDVARLGIGVCEMC